MTIDGISNVTPNYYVNKTQYASAPAFKANPELPKSNEANFWLGFSAAAASVIAGIAIYKNHSAAKKLLEQSEKLKNSENKVKELEEKLAEKTKHSGASSETKNVSYSSSSSGGTHKRHSYNSGSNYHEYRQTDRRTAKIEPKFNKETETYDVKINNEPARTFSTKEQAEGYIKARNSAKKPEVKENVKAEPQKTPAKAGEKKNADSKNRAK